MNAAAVITLVASILAVDASTIQVDVGREDGLQPGDWGTIFFEVAAADHTHTVEVGPATVTSVSSGGATLSIPQGLAVKKSHLVRFELPTKREPVPAATPPPAADPLLGKSAESEPTPQREPADTAATPPPVRASTADVADRLAAVERTLERSAAVRVALLEEPASDDVLRGIADLPVDDLLARLSLTADALEPADPGEQAELLEELRVRDSELESAQYSLRQAEARVRSLERQIEASAEPATEVSPAPEEKRRRSRWKFWQRGKKNGDVEDSEDAGNSEDIEQ